ncbi:DUF6213 family protein [Streptomyces sp. H10-C2]|uniref:DUF6213 family protein n=1 Tax=unclassified Streptomyces TaxID=2593676 RepID=UPI0024BAA5BD|nr:MULTISPECIES: DUF6213 family protein [unclassified Streptomyces]MDJ0347437.1 DUF6213 family protein [Streptomyces sp. PH10-H1]MDJ0374802.1 DUF6213 family protein [Streptomyces sp. H10-C2]
MSETPLILPLIQDGTGQLFTSAHEVSALLRRLGTEWSGWSDTGATQLDALTVEVLVQALAGLADQIDVQCIDRRTLTEGTE